MRMGSFSCFGFVGVSEKRQLGAGSSGVYVIGAVRGTTKKKLDEGIGDR